MRIFYNGEDNYRLELAFGNDVFVTPLDKQAPLTTGFDYFRSVGYEFELLRVPRQNGVNLVTLGRLRYDSANLCFFAAGISSGSVPSGGSQITAGSVDGVALIGGRVTRLFNSAAEATFDYRTRIVTLRLELSGRDQPFGDFIASPSGPIGQATARLTLPLGSNYFSTATLAGPGNSTGRIGGVVFRGGDALGLVFELSYPNGDQIFGAIGTERIPS